MIRVNFVRGAALVCALVCALLFVSSPAFAASYTSSQSGDWGLASTWGGAGIPTSGDDVTITSNHVVTVSSGRIAQTVTLDSTAGNKMLVIQSGATLLVEAAIHPAITISAPSPGSTSILRIDGGFLDASNSGISITGGTSVSKVEFTASGGTATFAGDVTFAGTMANAQIDMSATSTGTVRVGGDLGSGGTLIHHATSNFLVNGTGAQTINGYTFSNLTVNKAGGTATLNGPIQVNGNFDVTMGVFDDGGNQISLNPGSTSSVSVGSLGVLKLGSGATATTFPAPHGTVNLSSGSAVVYQAGVAQTIQDGFTYDRLYLSTLGGTVNKTLSSGTLTVNGELNISDNGINTVTLVLGAGSLDANGDISGDGTVSLTTGAITIAGNWSNLSTLNAGTGTITYNGGGAQNVLGATYHHLNINKSAGAASFGGNATINGDVNVLSFGTLTALTNTVTVLGDVASSSNFDLSSGTLRLSGSVPQTVNQAFSALTVKHLELNNPAGASVSSLGTTITGSLTLAGGRLDVSSPFMIDVLATVTRTSGWIAGEVTMGLNPAPARRFHIGTVNAYLPVDVDSGSAGTVTLEAGEGKFGDRTANNVLERYWTLSSATATPLDLITFNYNQSDVVTGDENKYILAHYDSGTFTYTHFGSVNTAANSVSATSPATFIGNWVIGQPGSLAAASKLAIVSVNGGTNPSPGIPFNVVVEAQDDDGDATAVFDPTDVDLTVSAGSGTLSGTLTGTIASATDTITISGVEYSPAENGVVLQVNRLTGDVLDSGVSAAFNVTAGSPTITVTSINDNGAGTLRAAITDANSGACPSPCTIEFGTSGGIVLLTPLPAITALGLTIDGYSAPGASANTNAFGAASNAVITMALDGSNGIPYGFDIGTTNVKITGFAVKSFVNAGIRFAGVNTGSKVSGCHIGTDVTGMLASGNDGGVLFAGSSGASLGGTLPADRNIVSGNDFWGVTIDTTSSTISVVGNYIGTKRDLSGALSNVNGFEIHDGSTGVTLGTSGVGNVVSGNTTGIILNGDGATLVANLIGTTGSTATALANSTGILIGLTASGNVIGGASPSDVNVISGNVQNGILLRGNANTIDNNLFGIGPDGTTPLGNGGSGIRLENTAANNVIGTSFGNKFAYNANDGVSVATSAGGIGNAIRKNKIAGNSNRAIDLGDDGTTNNDATDADTGANNLQNYPVIGSPSYNAGIVSLTVTMNSSGGVNANFVAFDIYKADASSPAQAIEYLGTSGCLAGNTFASLPVSVPAGSATIGSNITATATVYSDAACNTPSEGTSELSPGVRVSGDIHWIAGSGNWETSTNWAPAVVPTSTDNAYLDNTGTYTVTINTIATVGTVHVGAASGVQTLSVPATQSLTLNGASTVGANGVLNFAGLNFGGNGPLAVSGTMNWSGGTIFGSGGLTFNSGSALNIDTASAKAVTTSLITIGNGATANWNGGSINLLSGAAFDNFGLFESKTDAAISDGGSAGTFDNHGTFRKSTTSGTTAFTNVTFNHNAGTVDVQTGTLDLAGGTAAAAITISSGATLLVNSHTYTFATGTGVTGAGKVHVSGGTLNVTGPSVLLEHLLLDLGTLGGSGVARSGSAGNWVWSGGTMSGTGQSLLETGSSLSIGTASAKSLATRTLTIQSGVNASWFGTGAIQLLAGGNIANGGIFDAQDDASMTDAGSAGAFVNSGTFKKSAGAGTTAVNVPFANTGTVQVLTGTFNPSTMTSSSSIQLTGTMLVDDSIVTLSGASDVSGTGLLRINGGTLTVDAADTLPNVQLDTGFLQGNANVPITSLTWNGGTMQGTGTTTIPNLAGATLDTLSSKSLQRTLSVLSGGTVTFNGGGTIQLSSGGNISNAGLFDFAADNALNDAGSDGGFANTGTLRKSGGAGATTFNGVDLTNPSGTIDVMTGALDLAGGSNGGAISLAIGTFLLVNSDTFTLAAGTTVTGTGTVAVNAGTLIVNGNVSLPKLDMSGGIIDGTGILTLSGTSFWTGGTMQGAGTTNVASTLGLTTASAKALTRTLSIGAAGTVNLSGTGTINIGSGGSISNSGLFLATVDSTLNDSAAGATFVNNAGGTFRKTTATGTTLFSGVAFTNNGGLVDLQQGILNITGDTFTQGSGTLKVWLGGTIAGPGFGQLASNQTVNLAGTLEVALNGLYQPSGGDTFRVLSAPAHIGDFTQPYTYPVLAGGRTFSDAYDASGLLLTVSGDADLTIAKSAPSNNVVVGGALAYTLQVDNNGPDQATGVSVTDTLPAGHSSITASGTGWSCNVVGDTVTCTMASLAVGSASPITINTNAPVTPQTFTNFATVSSASDPNAANDTANWQITTDPNQADLDVSSTAAAGPFATGTAVTIDFAIQNDGPQTATGVTFTAPIPSTLTYNSATPDAGSCNFAGGTVSCTLGNILNGVTRHVVIVVTTNDAGTQTVTGTANAVETDPLPTNDSITHSLAVTGSTLTVTNTADAGMGSLRQALLDAQNGVCTSLPCTIAFNVPASPFVIQPLTALPAIGTQIVVDATTQPGYAGVPIIHLDAAPNTLATGLIVNGNNSAVKGLAITGATIGIDVHGLANTIEANYVGLTPPDTFAGNTFGIKLHGDNNTVGGTTAAQRNVISGNTNTGVLILDDATGNSIIGNYIGTDPAGTASRQNFTGVGIVDEADNNTIGGPTAAHGNVISGNVQYQINITGAGSADNNAIYNNFIGVDAGATVTLGANTGIAIADNAAGTIIGAPGQGNVIGANFYGIKLSNNVSQTTISANLIGLAPDLTSNIGNVSTGITIEASNNLVGGGALNGHNNIAYNGDNGIEVLSGTGNRLLVNRIFNNTGIGIDLGGDGPTANDAGDADAGPNGLQNSPALTAVSVFGGGNAHVAFTIDSSASTTAVGSIRVDAFKAAGGAGGDQHLATGCFAGNVLSTGMNFNTPALAAGDPVVLTATSYTDAACTNVAGGTSEFSNVAFAACVPPAVNITGPAAMCAGAPGVVLDAGAGFATYTWTDGVATIGTAQQITVAPGSTTTYTVTVTNAGCQNSDSHTVTVNTPATPTITASGPTTFCAGGSVTLTASAGSSWLWSNSATTQQITVSAGGNYSVAVTDANGCTAVSAPVSVVVNPTPNVNITGATSSCANAPVLLDAGAGFASYSWSDGVSVIGNSQQITVSPAATATYSVTVNDGTCSATDTHTITVTSSPTATISVPPGVCEGSTGNNASVAAQPGATYAWTIGNGTITAGQGTNAITFTAGTSGNVTLGITVTSGSCTSTGNGNVPVTPPPAVTISGPTSSCATASITLSAPAGFTTYVWSNGATTPSITVSPSVTTTYTVNVTNASGCAATDSHVVTVTPTPNAVITAPGSAEADASGLQASVATQAGATYAWSITNGTITSGNGTPAIVFSAGSSGLTELDVTVTVNGCSKSQNHFVFIDSPQATSADLAITKTAASSVQAGGVLTYTIGVTNLGPEVATGVVINDTLPAGTTFVSMNAGPWNCAQTVGGLRCVGTANAGASSAIVLTVNAPQQGGTITNTVQISAGTADPNAANNSASATTNVLAAPPQCATAPPSLLSPANGASVNSPVAFSWSSVPSAQYELWIDDNLALTTHNTTASVPLGSGASSWFVVARPANGCDPLQSAQRTFTVTQLPNCGQTIAPAITSPQSGATVASPATFTWLPVTGAVGYRLSFAANDTATVDAGTTSGTSMNVALPAGTIVAYVDALFSGCPSTRSSLITLTVPASDPCANRGTAAPIAPANNASVPSSSVEFRWSAAAGAEEYRVLASVNGGAPVVVGTTSDTSLRTTIEPREIVWFVQSLYAGCAATDSQTSRFVIPTRNDCGQQKPELLSPLNGSTTGNGNVTFSWTSVPNALEYELWLALDHGTPALFATTTGTSLTRLVPRGKLDWFVRAVLDRCAARDSRESRVTHTPSTACGTNERPVAITPLPGSTSNAPLSFAWSDVGASSYELYIRRGNALTLSATTSSTSVDNVNLQPGDVHWFVRASFGGGCTPSESTEQALRIVTTPAACATLASPALAAPGQISGGVPFLIQWTPVSGATSYQLQISQYPTFVDAEIVTTSATSHELVRAAGSDPASVYLRVRAIGARCAPANVSAYSPAAAVFILPFSSDVGSTPVTGGEVRFVIDLGAQLAGQSFTATPKQPWLTVSPASGVVGANGVGLTVIADTTGLPLGTSLGAVAVTLNGASAGKVATHDSATVSSTLSVSLVTPVMPEMGNTPPPDALIIPAVAHANGINSHFQSDVRVSNTSPRSINYQLTFIPSGEGKAEGQQTTFSVEPGQTIALDDILRSFFGTGSGSAMGSLEIRPLTETSEETSSAPFSGLLNLVSFASSRTFNLTANGTLGQYVPAIPYANFIGRAAAGDVRRVLSLQQIAQSAQYRTNLGLLEASGNPAELVVRVFGSSGEYLTEFPVSLRGGQHVQLNSFLRDQGLDTLSDGRVEVEVLSEGGKVTAYASVLDNLTNDPLLVTPVSVADTGASKWVIPGIADLASGFANWQTDMRLFNAGTEAVDATLHFYSQSGSEPKTTTVNIPAGQVRQFDRALSSLFGTTNDGGALHITTPSPAKLIATSRTYNQTSAGTYGQFVSAVTLAEAAGIESRPLQLLQVEESDRFRSNIGFVEVSGKPVTLEITIVPPDAKFSAVTELPLKANEFRQLGSLLASFGLDDTHNARVTVRVIEGEGRVTAYASVIDMQTNDPTYVPAQ